MAESDKRYYERMDTYDAKRDIALSKMQNRGNASVEWHKHNTLTAQTLPDFKKAMKQADKEWKLANSK